MKKIYLLAIGALAFATEIKAQGPYFDVRDKMIIGAKIGTNYSNVYDAKGEDFIASGKFGAVLGGFIGIPIGKYLGVQPEVLLSQKGFQATGRLLGSTYNFTRTTTYLDVPLLFSFKPAELFTLQIGPQYSYLLKQKDVFANATTTIAQEQEFINDNIRKNTFCILGGIDINLRHVVVGGRAGWDVMNNHGDGTSNTPQYKNAWYQVTLAIRFYNHED